MSEKQNIKEIKGKNRKENGNMKRGWLIQRCTLRNSPETSKIDDILSFDYMGSAEYEFGAIGKSY